MNSIGSSTQSSPPLKARGSVVFKLTVFVALLLVAAIEIVSWCGFTIARGIIRDQIHQRLQLVGSDRYGMVMAYVAQQHERVSLVASRTRLRDLISQYHQRKISVEEMRTKTQAILQDAEQSTEGFLSISIIDPLGTLLTSTDPDAGYEADFSSLPAFQRGLTVRFLDAPTRVDGRWIAHLASPAKRDDELLGVVLVEVDVEPLRIIVKHSEGLGETGEVIVAAREGTKARYLFPPRDKSAPLEVDLIKAIPISAAIAGRFGSEIMDYNGTEVLAHFRPIQYHRPDYKAWGLVAKMDVDEAYAPLADLRRIFATLRYALVFFGLAASFWLARRFTRPVREMTEVVSRVATGNLASRVEIRGKDELSVLGRAFNQMAEQLEHSYSNLENRVRQRTEELAVARDSAESANKAKSEFLANISHEIRTPLNAVIGLTQFVLRSDVSDAHREKLSIVLDSAESLLLIIDDVLDISKIEARRLELYNATFNLSTVVNDVIKLLEARRGTNQPAQAVPLTVEFAPDVPIFVVGDALRLKQILTNLLGNALKFTEEGKVSLVVSCDENDGSKSVIRFAVKDTGIGISDARLESIFEKFEQADASTGRRFGGSGLGLAICKQLVELMGGEISVTSQLGEGSEFVFTIQVALSTEIIRDALTDASGEDTIQESAQEHWILRRGIRILVVEDSIPNQHVVAALLDDSAVEINFVNDGNSAIELVQSETFDLILMDIQLPGLDGYEVTSRIRNLDLSPTSQVPIIAMTAHASPGHRDKCLAAGMNGFVTKPVRPEELFAEVRRLAPELVLVTESASTPTAVENVDSQGSQNIGDETALGNESVEQTRPPTELVNWSRALQQFSSNQQTLHDIVNSYVNESQQNLSRLRDLAANSEFPAVGRTAHMLLGAMRIFEASKAIEACQAVENAANQNAALKEITLLTDVCVFEVERVLAELTEFLARRTES